MTKGNGVKGLFDGIASGWHWPLARARPADSWPTSDNPATSVQA